MSWIIRDWTKHYETAETRKLKHLTWIKVPNKHDGRGLTRLLRLPDGLAIFGTWILILQVASKMPSRGLLEDQDGPLEPQDIADKTGADPELIKRAFSVLSSKEIGWISQCLPESPEIPVANRREWKGMEGNGRVADGREDPGQPATLRAQPSATPSPFEEEINQTLEGLMSAHAAAGFVAGGLSQAEAAIGYQLMNAVHPDKVLKAIRDAHPLLVPSWRERRKKNPSAYVPTIARFIADGDYLHPPAAPAAPRSAKPYRDEWDKGAA